LGARPLTGRDSSAAAALPEGTGLGGTTGFIQAGLKTGTALGPEICGSTARNWPAVKNQVIPATRKTPAMASRAQA
jgi:hypothetical protein